MPTSSLPVPHPAPSPGPARRPDAVPTWAADLVRLVLVSLASGGLATGLMLLASTGWMRLDNGTPIVADGAFAGILLGCLGPMWLSMLTATSRPDHGFRHGRLAGLLVAGILGASAVHLVAALAWSAIAGERATPGSVLATVASDGGSLALVVLVLVGSTAWLAACFVVMLRGSGAVTAVTAVAFALGAAGACLLGALVLDAPPSPVGVGVWAALAATGLLAVAMAAAVLDRRSARADARS